MGKKLLTTVVVLLALIAAINAPQKYIPITVFLGSTTPYNTTWSGISDFKDYLERVYRRNIWNVDVDIILLDNFSVIDVNASKKYGDTYLRDVLVLIGPDIPLNDHEINIIRCFIKNGGSLLIADELGTVNNIIKKLFYAEISNETVSSYLLLINEGQQIEWYADILYPVKVKSLKIDLPSYLVDMGILKPCGYYIDTVSGFRNKFILAGCTVLGVSRVYVIADTSIFINKYFSEDSENSYLIKNFVVTLFNWLTGLNDYNGYGGHIRIYIDSGHYISTSINMPLPHIGRIIASYLESYGSEINEYFYSYIVNVPILMRLVLVVLITLTIYRIARRWYAGETIHDFPLESVGEQRIVVFSPEYEKMKVHIRRRGVYKQLIGKLYELTNIILKRKLNLVIEDLVLRGEGWDIISLYLSKKEMDEFRKVIYEMYRVKEYLEGKRRLIPIIMWKRRFNKYVRVLNQLFAKLGFELVGE
mgnify:CR=1 FL=1